MSYSDLEYEIFSRQFVLQNFNEENIQKLNKAKITIVGLGFWFSQQGSIISFVFIIFLYCFLMNKLDKKYNSEGD